MSDIYKCTYTLFSYTKRCNIKVNMGSTKHIDALQIKNALQAVIIFLYTMWLQSFVTMC
jgi:hypothetical protein